MRFRQQSGKHKKHRVSLWFFAVWSFATLALIYGRSAHSDAARTSPADLGAWHEHAFKGHTQYRVEDGALHATARGQASALCRDIRIDLKSQSVARWDWRLEIAPPRTRERERPGDDQGLRVSFLHRAGETPESTIAIQYVWSQNEPVDARWPNAFVPSAYQIVARRGPAEPGKWRTEQRNLRSDFRTAFGRDIDRVDAICIMTDGDQTGALVEGWYGDIVLQEP